MPGIIWSASGSQELGTGVASILSGKVSPAGRLNMTWYISDEDLPDMNDYDIIKGKRTYQYFDREVLYPFWLWIILFRIHLWKAESGKKGG